MSAPTPSETFAAGAFFGFMEATGPRFYLRSDVLALAPVPVGDVS